MEKNLLQLHMKYFHDGNECYFLFQVNDQMRLLENSWSEMLILDQIHQRMHNHLQDEIDLPNGQKFELLSLALLGVPSMSDAFAELTNKLSTLKFDSADYVCLKFILLLNPGIHTQNILVNLIFALMKPHLLQTCGRSETEVMFKIATTKFEEHCTSTVSIVTRAFR